MRTNVQMNMAFRDPTFAVSSLGVVFGMILALSFRFSLAQRFHCRSVHISISRFQMRIIEFLFGMCRPLIVDLQHICQLFQRLNLHLVQRLQYVVKRSVCDC